MKIIKILFAIAFVLLIAACSNSSGGEAESESSNEGNNEGGLDSSVELTLLDAGGTSGESVDVGYIEPFTEKTGIKVNHESPFKFGKLKAMVESGQQLYDVVELPSAELYLAMDLDLLEKLDWDVIDPDPLNEEAMMDYGLGFQYYSTIMTWAEGTEPLESWADFWDVEKFPGKRSLPDFPEFALPIALMADGVPKDELFPLDLDRAFESLEKIKDHVSIWWEAGSQPPQLLADGEVAYAASWSGRVIGQPGLEATYNEGLLDLTYFGVPKGNENMAEVQALLHEMTIAENQAKAAEVLPYTGASTELNELLTEEQIELLPTTEGNYEKQALQNGEWWFENGQEAEERWQQFKLGLN